METKKPEHVESDLGAGCLEVCLGLGCFCFSSSAILLRSLSFSISEALFEGGGDFLAVMVVEVDVEVIFNCVEYD